MGMQSRLVCLRRFGFRAVPTDVVEEVLDPRPVHVDRDRAWAALGRDKKRGLVLLGDDGAHWDVPVPADDVRGALDELIAP